MRFADQVAIITGGGQGIGKTYVLAFSREGARVVVADIDEAAAEQTAREVRALGGEALAIRADVSNAESVGQMVKQTLDAFGRIDILVNNAALFAALLPSKSFEQISEEEWDHVMAVNVKGIFLCIKAVAPHLKAQRRGKIINISSSTVFRGTPGFLHYVTSKGAVIGLTRSLARELGDYGINVNAVTPGLTASEGAKRGYPPERFEQIDQTRSFKRTQQPEDLVGTVLFLASDDSSFLTGQTINVDGGSHMH